MPEETETSSLAEPSGDAPLPPLESSPEFQERTKEALGGPPTQPPTFRAVGKPAEVVPAASALGQPRQQKRPHNPAFDGPAPDLTEAREKVKALQSRLNTLRTCLEQRVAPAFAAVDAVNADDLAKAESELQGVDLALVQEFLQLLEDARTIESR